MKRHAALWLWLLALGAVIWGVTGCATGDPGNDSVRPWNTPQGWEGGVPMMDGQHP
jgi:hypothetical protein